jgi:uncharacterized protein
MKMLLKRILLIFAAILLLLAVLTAYSYFIEPRRLVITEETLNLPNWSAKLNGFKVVAVSDIHGGSNGITEEKLRHIVAKINDQNADIVFLLGDYVSQIGGKNSVLKMPSETVAENLKGIKAKNGVYAVIGNHDWWYDEAKITAEFAKAGIMILENQNQPIKLGDQTINIWGIEDNWKKRRVPLEPLEKISDKRNIIAITHNPDSFDKTPESVSLMLAGHTHGGQILIPFYGAPVAVSDRKFYSHHYVENGRNLFITSGIGTSVVEFRFRVPPEIAVLTLNAAN